MGDNIKKAPKRTISPGSSKNSNPQGRKNSRYNVPANPVFDAQGNIMNTRRKTNRTSSLGGQSQRSTSSISMASVTNFQQTTPGNLKPKPVFVDSNYATINNVLTSLGLIERPKLKLINANKMQINCATDTDKGIEELKTKKFSFYTFTEPSQKPLILVLKGIDDIFTCDEILKHIKDQENPTPVIKVSFLVDKPGKPKIHLVHFTRGQHINLNFVTHKIRDIDHLIVKWERFDRVRKRITQCMNCQAYGHAASQCGRAYKCVKCLDTHEVGKCSRTSRDQEGTPKCVNCKGDHAANSRLCPSFKTYNDRIQANRTNRVNASKFVSNNTFSSTAGKASLSQSAPISQRIVRNQMSYSDVVSSNLNGSSQDNPLEKLIHLQERLAKIPNISKLFESVELLITCLEQAPDDKTRQSILFKHLLPSNGN